MRGRRSVVAAVALATVVTTAGIGSTQAAVTAKPTTRKPVLRPVATPTTRKRTTTTARRATTTAPPAVIAMKLAQDLFARTNQERAARSIAPLVWDEALTRLAAAWAGRLSTGPFVHRELQAALELPEMAPFSSIGENIAMMPRRANTGRDIHQAWMRSDPHRANMLQPGWDSIGIGVFCDAKGRAWAVQNFGRGLESAARPAVDGMPPLDPIASVRGDALSC